MSSPERRSSHDYRSARPGDRHDQDRRPRSRTPDFSAQVAATRELAHISARRTLLRLCQELARSCLGDAIQGFSLDGLVRDRPTTRNSVVPGERRWLRRTARVDEIVSNYLPDIHIGKAEFRRYLTENISYTLDDELQRGMELYFELAKKHGLCDPVRELTYAE